MSVGRPVYFVDGSRTPFLKARGKQGPFSASDLAVSAGRAILARQPFEPEELDQVVLGCAMPGVNEVNIGRILALRLGCGDSVPGWTVMRNCASAMQALDSGAKDIALGRSDLVLAGGTESMSRAPVLFNDDMVNWLGDFNRARKPAAKAKAISKLRPKNFAPVIGLLKGLTDPIVELNMGQTCEVIAHRFGITRNEMDAYAVRSHLRLANAFDNGWMDEVVPLFDHKGNALTEDDGMRRDSNVEKLGTLKPVFDRQVGLVTAANSSQVTDGAALMLMASEEALAKYNLQPMGRLVDTNWAALDPREMGLGPVHASTPILKRNALDISDLDYWEINEAFAGQVLACLAAWQDKDYCNEKLKTDTLGAVSQDALNIDGGAISTGHPVGASGARIVLHALKVLERTGGKQAVATLCIGGGQGGAMLVERMG